jgi:excinuclease ABC subunit A
VATLVAVFDRLLAAGATIIVIDHDLDLLAAADHLVDMGPGGGPDGGHILAAGTPEEVSQAAGSVTGPWLADYLGRPGRSIEPDWPATGSGKDAQ